MGAIDPERAFCTIVVVVVFVIIVVGPIYCPLLGPESFPPDTFLALIIFLSFGISSKEGIIPPGPFTLLPLIKKGLGYLIGYTVLSKG